MRDRDYPMDRFAPVLFWPMDAATRVRSKPLKLVLALSYFPWFILLMPVMMPILLISIAWSVWDEVNDADA